ncbi:NPCBM/NEW2 domain-containing protein [Kitasatospora misakiensis]|uniref:NPCBM/NEW2 domain-containing protein n=1 Tax=Kitasatospora misakiensis TaxID=67330 RepID=A0ABW0WYL7_9ACTN
MVALATTACGAGGSSSGGHTSTAAVTATQTVTVTTVPSSATVTSTASDPGSGSPSTPATGAQYLSETEPLASSYGVETGPAAVNGRNYARSVSLRTDRSSIPTNEAEYNLERSWQTFHATVGVRDDSPADAVLTFEVFIDGRSATRVVLHLGQSQDLSLDVGDALRLKIAVTYTATVDTPTYCYGAWGDARLEK